MAKKWEGYFAKKEKRNARVWRMETEEGCLAGKKLLSDPLTVVCLTDRGHGGFAIRIDYGCEGK